MSSPRFVAATGLTFPHMPYLIECWVNFLKVVNLISALIYLKDTLPSIIRLTTAVLLNCGPKEANQKEDIGGCNVGCQFENATPNSSPPPPPQGHCSTSLEITKVTGSCAKDNTQVGNTNMFMI